MPGGKVTFCGNKESQCTCSNNAPNCDLRCVNFAMPFSKRLGMERNLRVCPVGAVSNTTTEKLSSFTSLR